MSNKIYRAKDRIILIVFFLHILVLIPVSFFSGHLEEIGSLLAAFVVPLLFYFWRPGTLLSRSALGIFLMLLSSILIHLTSGLLEMHFHIFLGLALLSIYYDWRVIAVAATTISLHQLIAAFFPSSYLNYPETNSFVNYGWYILFIFLTSLVLSYQSIMINRSVNTVSQSSRTLLEQDLPQMLDYMQKVSEGELGGQLEFTTKSVPVVALDELGDLTKLFNQLVESLQTIAVTTTVMGQALRSMLNRSYENIAHIRNLYTRMAYSTGTKNYSFPEGPFDVLIQEVPNNLRDQIETVSIQMVLAAVKMDEMQHILETKITEQDQLNQQLQLLNERKSQLFSTLSHELRTPLTEILGFSELLALQPLPAEEKLWVERIIQCALDMRQLINDVMDFSKIEAGKIVVYPDRASIADLFARLREEEIYQNNLQNLTIEFAIEGNPVALADATRLHQILINLLNNALKYTPSGGKISLKAWQLSQLADGRWELLDGTTWESANFYPPFETRPGEWVAIQVQDTGIGIPQKDLPAVFQEFEKIEYRIRNGGSGAGLGLALVKKFATLMSGQVAVASEIQQGATFIVLLPAWQPLTEETLPLNPVTGEPNLLLN